MKLTVRMVPDTGCGTVPALCDEQGNILPGQQFSRIEYAVNRLAKLTVTFVVMDGSDVEFSVEPGKTI